jgi:hypothetical protein
LLILGYTRQSPDANCEGRFIFMLEENHV